MSESTALKIALEALVELGTLDPNDADYYRHHVRRITSNALRGIRRDHYLSEHSPVVRELLAGVRV